MGRTSERTTERANPNSAGLDRMETLRALEVFQKEDERMLAAVAECHAALAAIVDDVAPRLARGGRLVYVGAGTSGRLGGLDAVECPPTFGSDPTLVQAVLAGGAAAWVRSVEGAEDSAASGAEALREREVGPDDFVLGIAASGRTPFVAGALAASRAAGAATGILACVPAEELELAADHTLLAVVGPEVLAGSTRLKAGTATKILLGRLSTMVMARLGKVYDNLMVDVVTAGNEKLQERGRRLVQTLTGLSSDDAGALLDAAGGQVKVAAIMHGAQCDRTAAEKRLVASNGHLRAALGG